LGHIIFWGIIRTAILIPALWILSGYLEYKYWWTFLALAVYGVIIHPAYIQYRQFMEANTEVITNTLCSSCKHFNETAVLCLKYDKHPTRNYIPCDGIDWEVKNNSFNEEEIDYT
jgi:hypothetical protein